MGPVRIRHSSHDFATQLELCILILWTAELGGKPKWRPLKFGYHDVTRTTPNRRFRKRWWRPQILHFCGDDRRHVWSMHVLIRPWLSPYTSIVPAKLQDLRPSPSFTKSSIDHRKQKMPWYAKSRWSHKRTLIYFMYLYSTGFPEKKRTFNCKNCQSLQKVLPKAIPFFAVENADAHH